MLPELTNSTSFMLSEEPAVANAIYIGYASPNDVVANSEEYKEALAEYSYEGENGENAYDLLYGMTPAVVNKNYNELYNDPNAACYRNFTPEVQSRVNTLWENLKLADATEPWVHITAILIIVGVIVLAAYNYIIKRRRSAFYRNRDREARKAKMNA